MEVAVRLSEPTALPPRTIEIGRTRKYIVIIFVCDIYCGQSNIYHVKLDVVTLATRQLASD